MCGNVRCIIEEPRCANVIWTDLATLGRDQLFTDFSAQCRAATEGALLRALRNAYHRPSYVAGQAVFPFELVIVGGDDVTIITTADRAIQVVVDFCDSFTTQMQAFAQECGQPDLVVAMSAGMVFAHSNYPIALLDDLAAQLLKSAKARSRQLNPDSLTPTVDFMVVTASTVGDLKTIRTEEYSRGRPGGQRLSQRPYTTAELRCLLGVLQDMKYPRGDKLPFPRTKLHDLRQIPFRPWMQAELDYMMLRSRLADTDMKPHRQMLRHLAEVGGMTERGLEGPWRSVTPEPKAPSRDTNLIDAVELYDFVPEPPPLYSQLTTEDET